jgi:tRNA-splicing ligase RtcB
MVNCNQRYTNQMPEINVREIDNYTYMIDKSHDSRMNVPGIIYSSPGMMKDIRNDQSLQQVVNVAMLPGIVKASMAMPDIHWGYGFPIGGVAAFDSEEGIVAPGGVGYDINCGVSLVRTSLIYEEIKPKIRELTDLLFKKVPSGMGSTSTKITEGDLETILSSGVQWCLDRGMATKDDLRFTEENGNLKENSPGNVSPEAKKRGLKQIGTLGAGNHFLEIQRTDNIFDRETANYFGIKETEQITVMVHTGSRGLGHQVATDFIRKLNTLGEGVIAHPVDRQLTSARIDSAIGMAYIGAMNSAANYGFVNRQVIVNNIREAFHEVFPGSEVKLVYSLAHNMAKMERHRVNGDERKLLVHRKGATRAFPGSFFREESFFHKYGHPVLIPGDMGTASYLLVGKEGNDQKSFSSSCHGAGRKLSRTKSVEAFKSREVVSKLESKGIYLRAQNVRVISEEAPGSYKDIDDVIASVTGAGLTVPVARLTPLGVVKG